MSRYKVRTAFMMIGCLVGVAALTLVVSVGSGAERKILQTVQRLFSASSIFLSSGGNLLMAGPRKEGARLTLADVEALASALPDIEVWDPMQLLDPAEVRSGDGAATARVWGASERTERVWERPASRGEYFASPEVARAARVALIGATVERALFAGADPLGAELQVGGVSFRVIGVLERMGTDAHGLDRDNEIVVPISTMMRRVMNVDTIRGAKILVKDPARVAGVTDQIRRILRERHHLPPGGPDDFTLVTPLDVQRLVAKGQRVMFVYLPLVAAITLLAGGLVAASLMLLSVNARLGEIGLRRAIGARSRDIALQFLFESVVTTLSGGVAGVLLGGAASLLIARRLGLEMTLSLKAGLLGLALSILIGLLAGVVPARRAARL